MFLNLDVFEVVVEVELIRDGLIENGGDKNDFVGDDDVILV